MKPMVVTPELLSAFAVLKPLPRPALEGLAAQSAVEKFARRAVVFKARERREQVCFLFEGRLQGVDFTIDGREVGLNFVEPGDFCGEIVLFDGGPQPEYVIALAASVTVMAPAKALRGVMLEHPGVAGALGAKLAVRVRRMAYQRTLLGLPNIAQRVCCQLWQLVPEAERDGAGEAVIRHPPTHMEIAIMLSVSRETVTRVFQTLQGRRIVRRDGPARLVVTDPQAMKACADGAREL